MMWLSSAPSAAVPPMKRIEATAAPSVMCMGDVQMSRWSRTKLRGKLRIVGASSAGCGALGSAVDWARMAPDSETVSTSSEQICRFVIDFDFTHSSAMKGRIALVPKSQKSRLVDPQKSREDEAREFCLLRDGNG